MLGILIANTGSPDAPTCEAVRRYLMQFLSDRRIVSLPRLIWLPLLHGVILNLRPQRSARLYRQVWTAGGSPLTVTTRRIAAALEAQVAALTGSACRVEVGMRYGSPSISAALRRLRDAGAERLVILPLFPQYSTTTTASIYDAVDAELSRWQDRPEICRIESYHDHPAYLYALAQSIREQWGAAGCPDHLLVSFHGIPQSLVERGDPYSQHCRRTGQLLAQALGIDDGMWTAAFQSRFGPQEWLQPYTAGELERLGSLGLGRLDVVCPGFAADCLETLYEIDGEGRHLFRAAGGGDFRYLPALNDRPGHTEALAQIVIDHL